jgi:hypothetical protein
MPALDPLSPEVVYALKGNIALPFEDARTTTVVAAAASSRVNDAYVNPLEFSGVTAPAVTIVAGSVHKANR